MKPDNIADIVVTQNRELKEGVLSYILEDGKQAVFKPGDIRYSVAEVIAYRLSMRLGFPNVPEKEYTLKSVGLKCIDDVVGRIGMVLVDHYYNDFL
jgi:hypothetical protein